MLGVCPINVVVRFFLESLCFIVWLEHRIIDKFEIDLVNHLIHLIIIMIFLLCVNFYLYSKVTCVKLNGRIHYVIPLYSNIHYFPCSLPFVLFPDPTWWEPLCTGPPFLFAFCFILLNSFSYRFVNVVN